MKKRTITAAVLMAAVMLAGMSPMKAEAAGKVYRFQSGFVIRIPCRPGAGFPGQNWPDIIPPTEEKPEVTPPEQNRPEVTPPEQNRPEVAPPEQNKPEATPSAAEQVVQLVNEERVRAGLQPLAVEHGVTAAANVRAVEIKTSFSHTRPDGRSAFTALKEQGVSYRGAGENIAWGQKSPAEVMQGWMNSEGHRANILNAKFTKIGVGHYKDENGRNYWTQMFIY